MAVEGLPQGFQCQARQLAEGFPNTFLSLKASVLHVLGEFDKRPMHKQRWVSWSYLEKFLELEDMVQMF